MDGVSKRGSADRGSRAAGRFSFTNVLGKAAAVALLGFFALLAFTYLAWPSGPAVRSASLPPAQADRVDVVYFHRTQRCYSCQWMGDQTLWTVQTYFGQELSSGRVVFRDVDVQQPENAALAKQYNAYGSSLYLNYVKGGQDHIAQAADLYPFIGDQPRFTGQLRAKIAFGLQGSR